MALFSDKQWLAIAMALYDAKGRASRIKGEHDQHFGVQIVEETLYEMLREDNARFDAFFGYRFGRIAEKGPIAQVEV